MNRAGFVFSLFLTVGLLFLAGCTTDPSPEKQGAPAQQTRTPGESRRLTVVSGSYLALEEDITRPQGMHDPLVVFGKDGSGIAYMERSKKGFRVVHNGEAGAWYPMIGDLTISNDGNRVAYVVHVGDTLKSIVADSGEGPLFTEIGMPKFSPDGKHLVYTITQGKEDRLVVDHKVFGDLWVSQDVLMSPDSGYMAFAAIPPGGGAPEFIITDFEFKDRKIFKSCGESVVTSRDGSRIAVVCSEGGARRIELVDFESRSLVETLNVPERGTIIRKRFGPDNRSFVYTTATEDYQRFLHYNGRTEKIPDGDEIMSDPLVLSNPERVGVIIGDAFKVRFYGAFQDKKETEKEYGYISDFVASGDGRHHAYVAVEVGAQQGMRIVVDGNEGPLFDKIVSPLFSPDGEVVVYRARQDGRRFLVISDLKGTIVRRHTDHDMVFQPVFVADGTSVAYAVLDGNEFWWEVEKLEQGGDQR